MLRPVPPLLLALLVACGPGPPPGGRSERVEQVHVSLLTSPAERVIELENPARPVGVESVLAAGDEGTGRGPLPALVTAPPARVTLALPPDLPPGAQLALAIGFGADSASAGPAAVRFAVALDGRPVAATRLDVGRARAGADEGWVRSQLPLEGVSRVTLSTELVAGEDVPVDAAWGRLEVVVPRVVERRASTVEAPNVVLVVIDTLRADRLGCYGYDRPTSPAIDALAQRGTRYDRAFASSSWTWPSTASLLSGVTPPEHGLVDRSSCFLPHELNTLAESMRRAGLHTAAFSANPLVSHSYNFHQGFDRFDEFGLAPAVEVMPAVEAWLRARADERFFLYLHLSDPHGPYEPDLALAGELVLPEPPGYELNACHALLQLRLAGEPFDEAELARFSAYISSLYDGEVRTVDEAIRRLEELLVALGVRERTVVALTSDHGEEFLDHGLNGHGRQLYDELVTVPLLLAGPGVPAGRALDDLVEIRYLPQTLLRLAGLPVEGFDDRFGLLREEPLARVDRAPVFLSTETGVWVEGDGSATPVGRILGVRTAEHGLDWAPRGEGPEDDLVRLFDLRADPGMQVDLAAREPERAEALRQAVEAWFEQASARGPELRVGGSGPMEALRGLGYVDDE